MSDYVLAVLLSVVSAGCYAVAAVVQERLAALTPGGWPRGFLGRGRWWFAVGLNAAGGLLHVAALRYGPLSLVQPLGLLTLVLAMPLDAAMTGRRVSAAHWRGTGMGVAGLAVLLLLTTSPGSDRTLQAAESLAVAAGTAAALGLLMLGAAVLPRASLLYAAASGLAFGVASALTKTVAVRVTDDGVAGLIGPAVVAVAVFSVSGLLLSQAGYRGRGIGAPLATATLVNPVVATAIGLSLLDEGYVGGVPGAALAVVAAVVAGRGVVLLIRLQTSRMAAAPGDPEASKAASGSATRSFSRAKVPLSVYRPTLDAFGASSVARPRVPSTVLLKDLLGEIGDVDVAAGSEPGRRR